LHDRKPLSLTAFRIPDTALDRIDHRCNHRLQRRIITQRSDDPGLSDRDAGRGLADAQLVQNSLLIFAIFLIAGMVFGRLARMALDETIGSEAGIGDRQPAYLVSSPLRPWLSTAGQMGFKSLSPNVAAISIG
jgi:hypothetical protein